MKLVNRKACMLNTVVQKFVIHCMQCMKRYQAFVSLKMYSSVYRDVKHTETRMFIRYFYLILISLISQWLNVKYHIQSEWSCFG